MYRVRKYNLLSIVTSIVVTMLFSCNNNLKEIQKIGLSENEPLSEAENINAKYIDSGKVKAILISPKRLDYSNRNFAFEEFPQGVNLEVYDDENKKSNVVADYAIYYRQTGMIDLQGNVKLTTSTNDTLFAEQLYYNQRNEWLFTNRPVTFRTKLDVIEGNGFDSNKNFTNAEVLEVTGIVTLDE